MASAKKRASARTVVKFRDLESERNPVGGIERETRVKTG